MTVGLVMMVRNEEAGIAQTLESVKPLIDWWSVCDTGSTDHTKELVCKTLGDVPGELSEEPWQDYGHNRTVALNRAVGMADWLLTCDADWKVEAHPDLLSWLAGNPDPEVGAWMVPLVQGVEWRLPLLVRGDRPWHYIGPCHEYLDTSECKTRQLLGLTIRPTRSGGHDPERFAEYIRLLAPGVENSEPRAVFYTAESLRFLGQVDEAAAMYERRAEMGDFEEEAWYAAYQAARLREDVQGLIVAWGKRPWRHEPLTAAGKIVGSRDNLDVLFREAL